MSNSAQDPSVDQQRGEGADTQMESPAGKGKGKVITQEMPVDDSEEDDEDEEEGEEEADEDNMEAIDVENIVSARTRNKNIDFAQAAKDYPDDDEDDEDDEDFDGEDDDRMEE